MNVHITARKKAEQALLEKERHLRAVLDSVPESVSLSDEECRILSMNPAGVSMMEAESEASVLGLAPFPLINPEHREAFRVVHQRAFLGESGSFEFEITGLKGTHYWLETTVVPLRGEQGGVLAALSVTRDVTERKRLAVEQQRLMDRLRDLSAHLERAREEERIRISREIHDELGQQLTGLKMQSAWIRRLVPRDAAKACQQLDAMNEGLTSAVRAVSRIAAELRPGLLDTVGLVPALEGLAIKATRDWGIPCRTQFDPLVPDPKVATAVFRVAQEALTNVFKHSAASEISMSLKNCAGGMELRIGDNGIGLRPGDLEKSASFGVVGMRERLAQVNGNLDLYGGPKGGLTLVARVPMGAKAATA